MKQKWVVTSLALVSVGLVIGPLQDVEATTQKSRPATLISDKVMRFISNAD